MQILSTILAYGYLIIVGFIFLVMMIQVLAFYLAGKITGSINDEFTSAFSLFGAFSMISIGSTLVNAAIRAFLPNSFLAFVAAAVLFLFLTIYAIAKIYDLSPFSAFLHLIISFGITIIAIIALTFLGFQFLPKGGSSTMPAITTENAAPEISNPSTESSKNAESPSASEGVAPPQSATNPSSATPTPSGPKLPSASVGSHAFCGPHGDFCKNPDELCYNATCQSKSEFLSHFDYLDNCGSHACENCAGTGAVLFDSTISLTSGPVKFCGECDEMGTMFKCKSGFTCKDYKCVQNATASSAPSTASPSK